MSKPNSQLIGWRLRSGYAASHIHHGRNPHPTVCVRERNLEYWNFNSGNGAGKLIYYDVMRDYKFWKRHNKLRESHGIRK